MHHYLLVSIIIISSILLSYCVVCERFTDTPLLVYKTDLIKDTFSINVKKMDYSSIFMDKIQNIRNIKIVRENGDLLFTDAFSFNFNKSNLNFITAVPDNKYALFIKSKDNYDREPLSNVIKNNRIIGYFNDEDKLFIKYLALSLGISVEPQLVKLDKFNSKSFTDVYCIFLFTCLSNPLVEQITEKIDFLDYEDLNIDKLKLLMPYSKIIDIDLAVYFHTFKGTFSGRSTICFDMILGSAIHDDNRFIDFIINFDQLDINNYYTMYFTPTAQTLKYLSIKNKHIQNRDNLPILEQFTTENAITFDIEMKENVPGFYQQNKFITMYTSLNGIPLTLNSIVKLNNQEREEENGIYTVIQSNETSTLLEKKQTKSPKIENPTYDPRYECYNQPSIKSRGLCESPYDAMGLDKKPIMMWDRRCEKNEECPFYQANKNYNNYFGGCNDGYCQMPIGVEQTSYRKFDPNTKPMCHRCNDIKNPYCCEEQETNKEMYPNLKSPDYAFPLDQYNRMKQIINL